MNPASKPQPPACPRLGGIASALFLTASSTVLQAATYDWDGTTGSFGDNTSWSADIIPIAGDTARVLNGGTVQIGSGLTAPVTGTDSRNRLPRSSDRSA